MKHIIPLALLAIFSLGCSVTLKASAEAEPNTWPESYREASEFLKKGDLYSASMSYYRAQLASSWAGTIRRSAFVGNGNDPGTFRAAINEVLGQSINPWVFENPQQRLLPILNELEAEVNAIKTDKQLSESIFAGLVAPQEEETREDMLNKYPFNAPPNERLAKFKIFAANWLRSGRAASAATKK